MLEFPDIDIENDAAQVIALEGISERILVDDLAPGDIDEEAPRLHGGEAILVKESVRLRRPLAADHDDVASRQEPVEIPRAAELCESRRQGRIGS